MTPIQEALTDAQIALTADWLRVAVKYPHLTTVEMAESMGTLFAALMEMRKKTDKGQILAEAFV